MSHHIKPGRNFGAGTRDMADAGRNFLKAAGDRRDLGQESVATYGDRFSLFVDFLKATGINQLGHVDDLVVIEYGETLASLVEDGEMKPSYAQNLLSSVNTVMGLATRGAWATVSPTRDCGIQERDNVRKVAPPCVDRAELVRAIEPLDARGQSVARLARDFGLRAKEVSLLNPTKALEQALTTGQVEVRYGTKGGLVRQVPITSALQIDTLRSASAAQAKGANNLIPRDTSWKKFQGGELRQIREALQLSEIPRLHDLRAAYACSRYQTITGFPAAVIGGQIEDRELDRLARVTIAAELGHGRIDVTNSYLGGRS